MQAATGTLRSRLDYLVQATGRGEAELLAQAVELGLADLYRECVSAAYLAGELDRPGAVAELGEELVAELDFARDAVSRDVAWGLRRA